MASNCWPAPTSAITFLPCLRDRAKNVKPFAGYWNGSRPADPVNATGLLPSVYYRGIAENGRRGQTGGEEHANSERYHGQRGCWAVAPAGTGRRPCGDSAEPGSE